MISKEAGSQERELPRDGGKGEKAVPAWEVFEEGRRGLQRERLPTNNPTPIQTRLSTKGKL